MPSCALFELQGERPTGEIETGSCSTRAIMQNVLGHASLVEYHSTALVQPLYTRNYSGF